VTAADVQRLESERLRPCPDLDPIDGLFRDLLDLIAAECRRAGYLPKRTP
jgi:hypothetical protein